jgi:hypothetical protein
VCHNRRGFISGQTNSTPPSASLWDYANGGRRTGDDMGNEVTATRLMTSSISVHACRWLDDKTEVNRVMFCGFCRISCCPLLLQTLHFISAMLTWNDKQPSENINSTEQYKKGYLGAPFVEQKKCQFAFFCWQMDTIHDIIFLGFKCILFLRYAYFTKHVTSSREEQQANLIYNRELWVWPETDFVQNST